MKTLTCVVIMNVICLLFVLLMPGFCSTDIDARQFIDRANMEMYKEIERSWNPNGYWSKAIEDTENQYQEAIIFYCFMHDYYSVDIADRVGKAIMFSLEKFTQNDGAIIQNGISSYMRTAMFLIGYAQAVRHIVSAEGNELNMYFERIRLTSKWLYENRNTYRHRPPRRF